MKEVIKTTGELQLAFTGRFVFRPFVYFSNE